MARMRKTAEFESISRFKYNQQRMYNAPSRLTGRECSTILKSVNFTPQIFDSPFLSARALTEPRYANEESRRRRRKRMRRRREKTRKKEREEKRKGRKENERRKKLIVPV